MGDKLSTIERNVSLQLSDLTTIMPENLSDYYLALASLDLKTTAQISALEQNVSDIKDALTSHVTNSTQSIADVWSDVEGLFKTTESLRESLCVFKTGHSLTSGRCMNVSGVEADYQTAQANCAASGGHLLILKSRDVDAPVLRDVLTAAGITVPSFYNTLNYWVGATDISTEGTFTWNDGTPLPTSSELWNQLEPNDANNNEDCVEMYINMQLSKT
ncbi:C-type lectin domain family 4 member K-like [Pomacea canaliculata]|uniref:C-type lectin domain family 4 member K-like n=1 Tax=Pomacea canaliculata TaxID=400727 RepID=UPI000D727744|nr:C-type lectin domain family 4 member K-like [Pomacea canaliculata]